MTLNLQYFRIWLGSRGNIINPLSANPHKMVKHTQNNSLAKADELFEFV